MSDEWMATLVKHMAVYRMSRGYINIIKVRCTWCMCSRTWLTWVVHLAHTWFTWPTPETCHAGYVACPSRAIF